MCSNLYRSYICIIRIHYVMPPGRYMRVIMHILDTDYRAHLIIQCLQIREWFSP